MKPELIIFDFWNTLAFAEDYEPRKFFSQLGIFGINIKRETDAEKFSHAFSKLMCFAKNWEDFSRQLLKDFSDNQRKKNMIRLADFLRENIAYKLYDDVKEILKLPGKKTILTDSAKFLVESSELKNFGEIFTPVETGFLKPDPKVFLTVLKSFQVNPDKAVMIGDDPERDIAPAEKLGIKTILIDRKNKLADYRGTKTTSLTELRKIIEGL